MNIPTNAYPLTWPEGWPKPSTRARAKFTARTREPGKTWMVKRRRTIEEAREELFRQLGLLAATSIVLSSNLRLRGDGMPISGQAAPADPSCAVYFLRKGTPYVMPCGKWDRPEDNIWAIAQHIDALRGQERWGVGSLERAFGGYKALPGLGETTGEAWWNVLGVTINATEEQIVAAYRTMAKKYHPDAGTTPSVEMFTAINDAYEMALRQVPK